MPRISFETSNEPADAHSSCSRILFYADLLPVVLVKISNGMYHFFRQERILWCNMLSVQSVNHDKDFPQVHYKKFFVIRPVSFSLLDHPLKQILILNGRTRIDYMLMILKSVLSKDIRHVISSEVNPVNFSPVNTVIIIPLFFSRTVQHHITCVDDLSFPIEIEISSAMRHIQQLKVEPSSRSIRRKPRPTDQTEHPAAANKQRMFSVLKVYPVILIVGVIDNEIFFLRHNDFPLDDTLFTLPEAFCCRTDPGFSDIVSFCACFIYFSLYEFLINTDKLQINRNK